MKLRRFHLWVLLAAFVTSSLGSILYFDQKDTWVNTISVFVTVGMDQTKLANENSSYEIQRASEHFSDMILGWTVTPSFRREFLEKTGEEYLFTGQRQEKQNLLFSSTQYDLGNDMIPTQGDALLELLNTWVQDYNVETNAAYVLSIQKQNFEYGPVNTFRPSLGIVFLVMILTGSGLFLAEVVVAKGHVISRH